MSVTDPFGYTGDPTDPSGSGGASADPFGYTPDNNSSDNSTDTAAFADAGGTSTDAAPSDPTDLSGTQKKTVTDPTDLTGGTDASNLQQAAAPIPPASSDPTDLSSATDNSTTAFADSGGTSTAASDPTDLSGGAGNTIQDTYNPPDQKQGGGNWWDKVKSTVSDVGAQIKDSIDPNQEGWLPHLTPVDSSPQNDVFSGTNLKGDAASAAEGLATVAGYGTDVYNRAVAEGGLAANDLVRNADPNAIPDFLGNIPYDITGQQLPWQPDTNYQAAQYLADSGNGLSTILPGNAGGGDAGIYDVPLVGGVARLAGGAAATVSGLWGGPDSDAMNPSIDTEQLQKDIASGQYSDQQLQQKYPGNEAYRIIQEVLNPINYVEPEIAGFKAGDIVDHLVTAPSSRAINTLAETARATGWTPETTATADAILAQRGTFANRGVLDLAAPDAARALTDARVTALPGMENVSTAPDTIAGLYRGADALSVGAVDNARQLATDLSVHMTGSDGAASNYFDAMQTIERGDAVNRAARGETAGAGTSRLGAIANDLTGDGDIPPAALMRAAEKRGIDLATATPAEAAWARAEAAREMLAGDIRAAMYDKAGAAVPGTESALHKGLAGTFNATRGLLLAAGAPALAVQKFSDEWIRALTQGVVSVRPQDLATLQAGARFAAGRNLLGQGDRFQGFLDNGTLRSAAIKNDVLPPAGLSPRTARAPYGIGDTFAATNRYGEAMTPGSRVAAAAGAPFRAIGKFNDSLIGAPTQHVLLNAFYHDTKTLDKVRQGIADKAYEDVLRITNDPEEAAIARDRLATATTQRDFVRIGRDIQNTTGASVMTPLERPAAAPSFTGQSRYTPSPRVTRAMEETGGAPGLVRDAATATGFTGEKMPLPNEIAPAKYGRNLGSAGAGMGQPIGDTLPASGMYHSDNAAARAHYARVATAYPDAPMTGNTAGWKLHINTANDLADPTTHQIAQYLNDRGIPFKVGNGGEVADGKGMTVYIGGKDEARGIATDVENRFGSRIGSPVGDSLVTNQPFTTHISGRFDTAGDPAFAQYGRNGIPYLTADGQAIAQARLYGQSGLPQDVRDALLTKGDAAAAAKYGELYTGRAGKTTPQRGTMTGDIAAGDGGAGYLSGQQRGIRDDLNAMGGFGTGTTREKGATYGSAPRGDAWRSDYARQLAQRVDSGQVTAQDFRNFAQAVQEGRIAPTAANYDRMKDLGQVAALRKELPGFGDAYTELNAARTARFTGDVRPTLPTAEASPRPFKSSEAVKARMDALGLKAIDSANAPRQIGSDARFTPTQPDQTLGVGEKAWYHGSGTEGLTADALRSGRTAQDGLYGPGVYLTDNADVARTYADTRARQGAARTLADTGRGTPETPTMYGTRITPHRVLDVEATAPADVRAVFANHAYGNPETMRALDAATTTQDLYRVLKGAHGSDWPGEVAAVNAELKQAGVDALRYPGGAATGSATRHEAVVILEPQTEPRVIGSFDPTDLAASGAGFRPVQRNTFTPTRLADIRLADPRDMQAIDAAYQGAGSAVMGRGGELAQAQREAVAQGTQRGYRIIGNQGDQTTLGSWLKNGVGGVTPPVLPFAPFHIHSAQFWARTFANHPGMAIAAAQALGTLDDYGTLHLPNGTTVDGLIKLLTGLHLVDWAQKAYGYDRAVGQQGRNSPLQRIGKDIAYNTVGNNAFVRPFEYVADPLNSLVQQHTNPLLTGKTDFTTGLPTVDPRDQYKTAGAEAGPTGIAQSVNDRFGQPVNRGFISGVTNPGQWIGNNLREGVANLPGSTDLKEYDPDRQIPYQAQALMGTLGWDKARYSAAEPDALTGAPTTPDGKALLNAYQRRMDMLGIGKIAPVQVLPPEGAPVYPPAKPFDKNAPVSYNPGGSPGEPNFYTNKQEWQGSPYASTAQDKTARAMLKSDNPAVVNAADTYLNANQDKAYEYNLRAGSGGRDLGVGQPAGTYPDKYGNPNGYNVEPMNQAQYQTARSDIVKANPVSPDAVPFMDYNRQFLGNADVAALGSAKEQASLPGIIAGNAQRTGAGLPQDARLAQIAREEVLQQPVGTNPDGTPFTLGDLMKQPGNVDSIEAQLKGMPAGAAKTALEAALADAKARDSAQTPAAAAYFAQQDAAFKAGQVNKVTGNAKTDSLNKGIDGTFTVGDFLGQPGNVFDLERQIKGLASGPAKTALEKKLDAVLMSDLRTHPQVADYFTTTGQLDVAQNGYHPAGSSTSARTTSASKKPFVPYTAAQKAAYGRSLGGSSSSSSATAQAIAGRTAFDAVFGGLTKAEMAAAYKEPTLAAVLAKGARPSAAEWATATETLKRLTAKGVGTSGTGAAAAAYALPGAARYEPTFFSLTQADIDAYRRGVLTPHAAGLVGDGINTSPINSASVRGLPSGGSTVPFTPAKSAKPGKGPGGTYTAQQQANYNAIKAGLPSGGTSKKVA